MWNCPADTEDHSEGTVAAAVPAPALSVIAIAATSATARSERLWGGWVERRFVKVELIIGAVNVLGLVFDWRGAGRFCTLANLHG